MCEQEGWIREKEQIFSSEDVGKDLTGALRLLSQHKALEDEMSGRSAHLQQTIRQGEELVADNHFGAEKIKERIQDIQVLVQLLLRVKHGYSFSGDHSSFTTFSSFSFSSGFLSSSRSSGRHWSACQLCGRRLFRRPATITSSR